MVYRAARWASGAGGGLVVMLYATEEQVVHDMSLLQSLALETGQWAEVGTGRETAVGHGVLELRMRCQHVQHPLGVRRPVRRAVHDAAGPDPGRGEVEEL